jgi:hypothetical protein
VGAVGIRRAETAGRTKTFALPRDPRPSKAYLEALERLGAGEEARRIAANPTPWRRRPRHA